MDTIGLETFGVVIAGEKSLHVLEFKHGHDDAETLNIHGRIK